MSGDYITWIYCQMYLDIFSLPIHAQDWRVQESLRNHVHLIHTYYNYVHTYLIDYIVHVWRQQQIFVWILSYLYTIFHSRIRIKVKSWDRILFQQTCVVFSLNPNKNSWKWSQVRNKEINFCILTIFSFG